MILTIRRPLIFLFFVLSVLSVVDNPAAAEKKEAAETAPPPKHEQTGTAYSKSPYVHHVILFDAQEPEAKRIKTSGDLVLPFSTKSTCGHCHEYARVSSGWHFNAWDASAPPGRPGEPWFWVNRKAGVQLPLSQRPWEGTIRPGEVGLTPWLFLQRFGRHYPGGGVGEKLIADDKDPQARWPVTGGLEVNCLACHNIEPGQDMMEWLKQVAEQNFMWAATATSSLGTVKGSSRKMPTSWDRFEPPDPELRNAPSLKYDLSRFDPEGKVLMQLPRQTLVERCYFCHSTAQVGRGSPARWQTDDDVHIAAGMRCTDCHRNGLDHDIVRGYEGEVGGAAFTCQGCHYGTGSSAKGAPVIPGRLGAPEPAHRGLPNFHFDKLSCTACHSGPQPGPQASHVQTSRAHMLEFQGAHRTDDALPYILAPVFMPQSNGKIGAHRMIWPAFWARLKDKKIQPLSPEKVVAEAGDILEASAQEGKPGDKTLTPEKIVKILQALAKDTSEGQPVYVGGGLMYSNKSADGGAGVLVSAPHEAAKPFAWPLAHNVRPAQQALGAGGCPDCHSKSSPFFHGQVPVESFVAEERPNVAMSTLMGEDALLLKVWELSFVFRPLFVLFCVASALFVTGVLLWYLGRGVAEVSRTWR